MKIALRVPGFAPVNDVVSFIKRAERVGFAGIGVPDSQLLVKDPFIILTLAAQQTSRIKLFPAVTNPLTRHVSVLACLVETLGELASGRIRLIIGSGDTSVTNIGYTPATVAQMRDAVVSLKRLLAGETVFMGRSEIRLTYACDRKIPIFIAASGPRTIELAGEIADGAMINVGCHPAMLKKARAHLEAGAQRGGRDAKSLGVMWFVPFHLTEDMKSPAAVARAEATRWVFASWRRPWLKAAGIEVPSIDETPEEVRHLSRNFRDEEDLKRTGWLSSSFVSDDLIARICDVIGIYGTPELCVAKLGQMAREGAEEVFLSQTKTYSLPYAALKIFEKQILPNLPA